MVSKTLLPAWPPQPTQRCPARYRSLVLGPPLGRVVWKQGWRSVCLLCLQGALVYVRIPAWGPSQRCGS